jgi:glyoxylase-like metal-dependent hydrolase (beta-lactamase superfamily II)
VKIHSIDCGTLCPLTARLVNGTGSWFGRGRMVCHCWLIETSDGLVLVDTGLGTADLAHPTERLGRGFELVAGAPADPAGTAVARIQALGFKPSDVRHIVPTHLDLDHAGGLPDFPNAEVHVFRPELEAALGRTTLREQGRYKPVQWAHGPRWKSHDVAGERWLGFESVRALGAGDEEVLLVPLVGHTRGHCGVAARDEKGWLLHAGDAYFFHGEVRGDAPVPPGIAAFQRIVAMDRRRMLANQVRLRELVATRAPGANHVRVHSAHCPVEFDERVATSP